MSLRDCRDVPVSTRSRASLARYETAVELFHGYFGDPVSAIDAALAEDPQFILGHCLKAGLLLSATDSTVLPAVRSSLESAELLRHRANQRERGHMAAVHAWLEGDLKGAVALYGDVLVDHPRDTLALQLAHLADFYLGQSRMLRDRVARVLPHWHEGVPGYGYVLGMHAFGLEECGEYSAAEDTGRRAVASMPRDPWAIHAVAHVMEMQGRHEQGISWLNERRTDWAEDNGLAFHNWWHLALYHLDLGQIERVLELYDRAIRPADSAVVLEMVDATALLWRLALRGIDAGTRWKELADSWAPRAEEAYYAFNDMHAMMAYVAAGREIDAQRLLSALLRRVHAGGTNAAMTRELGLPICRGLEAFGRSDYAAAVQWLAPVRQIAARFGGSHAQRDVIDLTLVEAALRAGQHTLAMTLSAERLQRKERSPLNWTLAARARELAGDHDGTLAALTNATLLRARRPLHAGAQPPPREGVAVQ
jgi:tetratricopeptide (TPR) repeat protein